MDDTSFDLDAYLARVGYSGPLTPNENLLVELQRAQVFTIPFENLDIHLGRPIRIDAASITAKLVYSQRGGYCYELNGLFLLALRRLGFSVTTLAARNLMGSAPVQKSHQNLLVTIGQRRWLADLGFGGSGLIEPIPLEADTVFAQYHDAFRIAQDSPFSYRLLSLWGDVWQPLYGFTLEEHYPLDYAMMNHYNSTSPLSGFTQRRMVARPSPDGRANLSERELKLRRGGETTTITLEEGEPYRAALAEYFGIILPDDAQFQPPLLAAPR